MKILMEKKKNKSLREHMEGANQRNRNSKKDLKGNTED